MKILLQFSLSAILIFAYSSCKEHAPKSHTTDHRIQASPKDSAALTIKTERDHDRAIWQKPELVLKKLGDLRDKTLADIGAGTGYFSFRVLPNTQKVIAIDIDPTTIRYMDSIADQLPAQYKHRLETRLAEADDPKLKDQEADVILLVNTYLYLPDRVDYLKNLFAKLKPGSQMLIIDYKMKQIPIGPPPEKRIPLYIAEREIQKAGFKLVETDDRSLSYQYMILALKP